MKMKISPQLNQILTWSAKGQNHPLKASQLILTTVFKSSKKLVSRANNHFSTLHQKRIYCQQWAVCMWGTCDNDHQPHHSRNKHLANDLNHGSEAQNDKRRWRVQVLTLQWKCRNPTLAKCGGEAQHLERLRIGSPPGLPNVQSSTARPKTPCIEAFLVSLERYWNVDIENGLALVIWTSEAQVMGKRRAGSQTGSLTPDH
jgi:hypothetical protein